MPSGGEFTNDTALVQIPVYQGKATGLVIGGYDNQCLTVLGGPFEDTSDRTVEIMCLLHQQVDIVEMSVIIQLGALYHQEETFRVLSQQIDRFHRGTSQEIASLGGKRGVYGIGNAEYLAFLNLRQFLPATGSLVTFLP